MLAAQVALAKGAGYVTGCDVSQLPIRLAEKIGLNEMVQSDSRGLADHLHRKSQKGLDVIIDTVGTSESISDGLVLLNKSGSLVLLAVHEDTIPVTSVLLSGERKLLTSANNKYHHFQEAIDLMAQGQIKVLPLITHRFHLQEAHEAFQVMFDKDRYQAYKVVLLP